MKYLLTILLASIFLSGCDKNEIEYIPACLAEEIELFTKLEFEGEVNIVKYFFQGSVVYYLNPGFCCFDQTYEVVNSNCEVIGTIGGFAGPNINGVDFFKNAVFLKVVWEK